MKYLKPELYVQLNSQDAALADAAEEAIERASAEYNRRWTEIKPHMPPAVVRFYEEQCLHDADVFAPATLTDSFLAGHAGDVVIVAQQINTLYAEYLDTLAFLRYTVTDEPRVEVPVRSEVFSRVQPIWEWDEFDLVQSGVFSHSIFINDGRVVTVHFRDFEYHIARIVGPDVFRSLGTVLSAKVASL